MAADHFEQSDDLFAETRMSFGEHIEELRTHLLRAIKGLVFFSCIGFVLDGIGLSMGWPWFGIGRPMVDVIKAPVEKQLIEFHKRRLEKFKDEAEKPSTDAAATAAPSR